MNKHEVSEKLFILSNISEGETYSYVSNKNMVHNSYMTSIYRSYNGENRSDMYQKLEEILLTAANIYLEEKSKDILLLIKGAMKGINNLMVTYKSDKNLKEKFKLLITKVLSLIYEEEETNEKHMKNTFKNKILSKWSKQELGEIIGKGINTQVKHQALIYAGLCLQRAVMSVFLF